MRQREQFVLNSEIVFHNTAAGSVVPMWDQGRAAIADNGGYTQYLPVNQWPRELKIDVDSKAFATEIY